MIGKRKFRSWLITEILIYVIFASALLMGVAFNSGDITSIILIVGSISGAFFGANTLEHKYSKE